MSGNKIMASTCLALALSTTTSFTLATEKTDENLRMELERLAQRRIFFGHQSVGDNLLAGIKQLSEKSGVPVRIIKASRASDVPALTLGHTYVEKNGEPLLKLQSFKNAFGKQPSGVDIALVKFCYVDINANTDTHALFAQYQSLLEDLKAKNPNTTFVHVTAPLTSNRSGPKEYLKRLLGRGSSIQNVRREEFNSIMRRTYQGREPIFDLAHVESTAPDGKIVTVEWNGHQIPVMASAYTDDGGHLNSTGQLHAARELVSILSAIPVSVAPRKPTP